MTQAQLDKSMDIYFMMDRELDDDSANYKAFKKFSDDKNFNLNLTTAQPAFGTINNHTLAILNDNLKPAYYAKSYVNKTDSSITLKVQLKYDGYVYCAFHKISPQPNITADYNTAVAANNGSKSNL